MDNKYGQFNTNVDWERLENMLIHKCQSDKTITVEDIEKVKQKTKTRRN